MTVLMTISLPLIQTLVSPGSFITRPLWPRLPPEQRLPRLFSLMMGTWRLQPLGMEEDMEDMEKEANIIRDTIQVVGISTRRAIIRNMVTRKRTKGITVRPKRRDIMGHQGVTQREESREENIMVVNNMALMAKNMHHTARKEGTRRDTRQRAFIILTIKMNIAKRRSFTMITTVQVITQNTGSTGNITLIMEARNIMANITRDTGKNNITATKDITRRDTTMLLTRVTRVNMGIKDHMDITIRIKTREAITVKSLMAGTAGAAAEVVMVIRDMAVEAEAEEDTDIKVMEEVVAEEEEVTATRVMVADKVTLLLNNNNILNRLLLSSQDTMIKSMMKMNKKKNSREKIITTNKKKKKKNNSHTVTKLIEFLPPLLLYYYFIVGCVAKCT